MRLGKNIDNQTYNIVFFSFTGNYGVEYETNLHDYQFVSNDKNAKLVLIESSDEFDNEYKYYDKINPHDDEGTRRRMKHQMDNDLKRYGSEAHNQDEEDYDNNEERDEDNDGDDVNGDDDDNSDDDEDRDDDDNDDADNDHKRNNENDGDDENYDGDEDNDAVNDRNEDEDDEDLGDSNGEETEDGDDHDSDKNEEKMDIPESAAEDGNEKGEESDGNNEVNESRELSGKQIIIIILSILDIVITISIVCIIGFACYQCKKQKRCIYGTSHDDGNTNKCVSFMPLDANNDVTINTEI